jgi:hypothetical protein
MDLHQRVASVAAAAFAAVMTFGSNAAAEPWVDREITLPRGDWAFNVGLGVGHTPADDTSAGVNAEVAVGLTSRIELGLRTGIRFADGYDHADTYGRLFDRETLDVDATGGQVLANPEFRVRGALVGGSVFELSLEGRFVIPFADGSNAGLLFGVPMAFHLGPIVRLDVGIFMPVVFDHPDTNIGLHVPVDLWFQVTGRLWLGPMTGVEFDGLGQPYGSTSVPLGFGLGYALMHALDLKTMFLFPEINNDSRDFGAGLGLEARIE